MNGFEFRQSVQAMGFRFVRKCSNCGKQTSIYYVHDRENIQLKYLLTTGDVLVMRFPARISRLAALKNKIDVNKIESEEKLREEITKRISEIKESYA